MFTKTDLARHLTEISEEAKILKLDFVSSEKFAVQLKCKIDKEQTPEFYAKYCGEWIKKFSKFTATAWIVRTSFAKLKRLLFRKVFVCHRSGFNKRKKPSSETRNQLCKARIEFKIKFINRNTTKNDPHLKEGLNLTVFVDFSHTHKVRAPEALNLLRNSPDTEQLIGQYYEMGCSPVAAKAHQELTLIDMYGENSEILSNATLNPSSRQVFYVYGKKKKEGVDVKSFASLIQTRKDALESKGFTITFKAYPQTTVIMTPLMKRVINEFRMETVLIDSTNLPNGTVVTYYYIPSKVGALPIACVIHTGQDSDSYSQAFTAVKEVMDMEFSTEEPTTILLNDYNEQKIISTVYRTAQVMKSRYTLCSEIWNMMNDEENKVDQKKRHGLMAEVRNLIYSSDGETAEKNYEELKENKRLNSSPKLLEWVSSLWSTKEGWLSSFQENDSCLVDLSIRLTKEFIKRLCKTFNDILMVDVVTNILENQHSRTMMSHMREKNVAQTYTKFLCTSKTVTDFASYVKRVSDSEYKLANHKKMKKYLYLRTDTMLCDCHSGRKGRMCEHLCAIANVDDTIIKTPTLSQDDKEMYTRIVGDFPEEVPIIETDDIKAENNYKYESNDEVDYDIETQEFDKTDDHVADDADEFDMQSDASSPKSEDSKDYYSLEVKSEKCDPLEDVSKHEQEIEGTVYPVSNSFSIDEPSTLTERKNKYEAALRGLNDEFRRLNRFFSENPNRSNLESMIRLRRELSKIRPAEKVNFNDIVLKENSRKKRKRDP